MLACSFGWVLDVCGMLSGRDVVGLCGWNVLAVDMLLLEDVCWGGVLLLLEVCCCCWRCVVVVGCWVNFGALWMNPVPGYLNGQIP